MGAVGGISGGAFFGVTDPAPDDDVLVATVLLRLRGTTEAEILRARRRQADLAAAGETRRLGEMLLEQGSVDREQLVQTLAPRGGPLRVCPACAVAADAGAPHCKACGAPLREIDLERFFGANAAAQATNLAAGDSPASVETARPTSAPVHAGVPFDRYRLLGRLGAGGMGVVWKAWDARLDRIVALKQIRPEDAGDAEGRARFEREARLAARLRHDHILPVHDVGEVDGTPYITMDFIDGRTFADELAVTRDAKRRGSRGGLERLRHEVRILSEVADAVAAAHEQGVIHRDLKPGNVLLDVQGRAFVMDFGLAREVRVPEVGMDGGTASEEKRRGLTMTGQLLGTPAYMSPEQARGDAGTIGTPADVWALGAMLYEILTGESPFARAGSPWEVLRAVVDQEPVRPRVRHPHAPVELEAVALMALEKDTGRRIGSARDFGADLRRWLRGEPVEARRPSALARVARAAMRHRWVVGPMAAACLALLVAAGVSLQSLAVRRDRAEADRLRRRSEADLLDSLRTIAATQLEATLILRRAGGRMADARARFLPEVEAVVRKLESRGMRMAEAEHLLGRLHRALMDPEAALACQRRALAIDPGLAPARYERLVLLARKVRERARALRQDWLAAEGRRLALAGALAGAQSDVMRAVPEVAALIRGDAVACRMYEGMQEDLRALEASPVGTAPGQVACARGILRALADRAEDREEARRLLERALAEDPGSEEACEGLAMLAIAEGKWTAAIAALSRGLESDRGNLGLLLARADARHRVALDARSAEGDRRAALRDALADSTRALEIDPESREGRFLRGWIRLHRGIVPTGEDRDPEPWFAAAREDFDHLLARDGTDAEALMFRAMTLAYGGDLCLRRGQDPDEAYAGALAACEAAIRLSPGQAEPWRVLAHARQGRAQVARQRGLDADPLYRAAIEAFDRSLERDPADARSWDGRALIHINRGLYRAERGEDPTESFAAAHDDLSQSLARIPDDPEVIARRALVLVQQGLHGAARGSDAAAALARSIQEADRALARKPDCGPAWKSRGKAHEALAAHRQGLRQDPLADFARAVEDFGRAIDTEPTDAESWIGRGNVRVRWGTLQSSRGEDAEERFASGIRDLDHALTLVPSSGLAWMSRGAGRMEWAFARMRRRQDPVELLVAALTDLDRALEVEPGILRARPERAAARNFYGNLVRGQGEDPSNWYAGALADLDEWTRRSPADAATVARRAEIRTNWGLYRAMRGEDPTDLYVAAESDLEAALPRAPDHGELHLRRGFVRWATGRWSGAVADFERALALDPGGPAAVRSLLEDARAKSAALGDRPGWLVALERGAQDSRAGRPEDALGAFREGLRLFEAAAAEWSTAVRTLVGAHPGVTPTLAVACIALARAEARDAGADPRGESADRALTLLDRAVEFGWPYRDRLETDPAFAPLRRDPRWGRLLERIPGK